MNDFEQFKPPLTKEPDFDQFWEKTLEDLKQKSLNLRTKKIDYPTPYCDVYEIIFNGYDDTDIYGYLMKPTFINKKMPVLFHYHGFNGNGGTPLDFIHYVMMGISVVTFDIRGQSGKTKLPNSNISTIMCEGILDEHDYYYRAVYCDSIKILDIASQFDFLDETRIILDGGSQGGGIVMAVAALDNRPLMTLADVPSYSYFQGRYENSAGSVAQIVKFVEQNPTYFERVMKTLSYFDTMNMADKITCPVLASVGLKDNICPAKFYYASYNRITSPKEIKIYPLNGHEGGGRIHLLYKMKNILNTLSSI